MVRERRKPAVRAVNAPDEPALYLEWPFLYRLWTWDPDSDVRVTRLHVRGAALVPLTVSVR